jgi:ATP-binding cassette subfamily B protein
MTSLWRTVVQLLRLSARLDRARLIRSAALLLTGYLATPFIALGLRLLVDSAMSGNTASALRGAALVGVLLLFELMFAHFAHMSYFEVGELAETSLNDELLRRVQGSADLARIEDPDFADSVTVAQEDLGKTRPALEAVLQLSGLMLQLVLTACLLALLSPWLLLLPAVALLPVWLGRRAQTKVDAAKESSAQHTRRSRRLIEFATTPDSAKEIRLFGAQGELLARQEQAWQAATRALWSAQWRAAALRALGQALFALAYGGAVALVLWQAPQGSAAVGDLVLVITLAVQVSIQVSTGLSLLTMLQGVGVTMSRLELLRASTEPAEAADAGRAEQASALPKALSSGITLRGVGFRYPGAPEPVLDGVDLNLPAGSIVALVGENGAGKSTLVKLLCGLYQPTAGTISADEVDVAQHVEQWQARVAPLFQDFARLELTLREAVGIGDVARLEDEQAVNEALAAAEADHLVEKVRGGLDGLIGRGYGDGTGLSGGEWQRLGLARALMRPDPLLLVLDEPGAALDAAAEHALLERFTALAARSRARGGVTLFVSHRFTTVRGADLIVVLRDGRVAETGNHSELMARDGLYAELFSMQARVNA